MNEFFEDMYFRATDFFKNWIYPAWHLRNFLIKRYDVVKLGEISRCEYSDVSERMYLANMSLIKYFIEDEKPEEHVAWYNNALGNDVGHKYGEDGHVLYDDYKGMYIMDIIKEIYRWHTIDSAEMKKDLDYATDFWVTYLRGKAVFTPTEDGYDRMDMDMSEVPTSMDFFDGKDIDWDIIKRVNGGNLDGILENNSFFNKINLYEKEIFLKKQKYLHLCIEVREYLWT